jgi:hypothetical protein
MEPSRVGQEEQTEMGWAMEREDLAGGDDRNEYWSALWLGGLEISTKVFVRKRRIAVQATMKRTP